MRRNSPCSTCGLIDGSADIFALTVAHRLQGPITLFDGFFLRHLFKGDLADFFKILFANFFLSRFKLSYISIVTLFHILMRTLQNGLFFQRLHFFLFYDAHLLGFFVEDRVGEINREAVFELSAFPAQVVAAVG